MSDEEFCEKLGKVNAKIAIIDGRIERTKTMIGKFNDEYLEGELTKLYKQRFLLKVEAEKLWSEAKRKSIYPWV